MAVITSAVGNDTVDYQIITAAIANAERCRYAVANRNADIAGQRNIHCVGEYSRGKEIDLVGIRSGGIIAKAVGIGDQYSAVAPDVDHHLVDDSPCIVCPQLDNPRPVVVDRCRAIIRFDCPGEVDVIGPNNRHIMVAVSAHINTAHQIHGGTVRYDQSYTIFQDDLTVEIAVPSGVSCLDGFCAATAGADRDALGHALGAAA